MHPEEEVAFDLFLGLVEQLIRGERVKVGQEVVQIRFDLSDGLAILAEDCWLKLDDAQTQLIPIRTIQAEQQDEPQKDESFVLAHQLLLNYSVFIQVAVEVLTGGFDVVVGGREKGKVW